MYKWIIEQKGCTVSFIKNNRPQELHHNIPTDVREEYEVLYLQNMKLKKTPNSINYINVVHKSYNEDTNFHNLWFRFG